VGSDPAVAAQAEYPPWPAASVVVTPGQAADNPQLFTVLDGISQPVAPRPAAQNGRTCSSPTRAASDTGNIGTRALRRMPACGRIPCALGDRASSSTRVSAAWFTWRHGWTGAQTDRCDRGWPGRSCPVGWVCNPAVGPACPTSLVVSCPHGSRGVRVARCEWAAYWSRPARIRQRSATAPCLRYLTRS
jgi:hypothetical protein